MPSRTVTESPLTSPSGRGERTGDIAAAPMRATSFAGARNVSTIADRGQQLITAPRENMVEECLSYASRSNVRIPTSSIEIRKACAAKTCATRSGAIKPVRSRRKCPRYATESAHRAGAGDMPGLEALAVLIPLASARCAL